MTDKIINTTIEILGKFYSVRCSEAESVSLQQSADFLNKKMIEVRDSGKAINLERIAIITALNIVHEFLQQDTHKTGFMSKINQRITELQEKIENAISSSEPAELIYTTE